MNRFAVRLVGLVIVFALLLPPVGLLVVAPAEGSPSSVPAQTPGRRLSPAPPAAPFVMPDGEIALQVGAGQGFTCALTAGGGVKCWGWNGRGQLGNGTTTDSSTPVVVSGLTSGVSSIAVGRRHVCALLTSGGLKCWGSNNYGQLGDGTTENKLTPIDVSGLTSGVSAVAAGGAHTCVRMTSGSVKCLGWNGSGQLGDGTTVDKYAPVDVGGLPGGVTSLTTGEAHTCAITTTGGAKCWGNNAEGELGNGSWGSTSVPVDVSGLTSGVTAVSAGYGHVCAVTTGGGVKCWGNNYYGQLGDGTTEQRRTPVDVSGLTSGVIGLGFGPRSEHTCSLMADGSLKCWGRNLSGELGDGTLVNQTTPVAVVGLTGRPTVVAVGGGHTCARLVGGALKCWGGNSLGQLGDGTTTDSVAPVDVVGFGGGAVHTVYLPLILR